MTAWTALLECTRTAFRPPSFALFTELLTGWVCAPGRRTITAMIAVADPQDCRQSNAAAPDRACRQPETIICQASPMVGCKIGV